MGKLIEFDPSRRKKKSSEENKSEENRPPGFGINLEKILAGMGEIESAGIVMSLAFYGVMLREKIEEIERETEGFGQKTFFDDKEVVRKYTDDELVKALANSNSLDWHRKPALYRAIIFEVQERLRMIIGDKK